MQDLLKFNMNKIPEDGMFFTAQLDNHGHFVVLNQKTSSDMLRRTLVKEYIAKYVRLPNYLVRPIARFAIGSPMGKN